jgi:TRAP-type C4-dicarboxylate transport system permease small subunit
MKQRVSQITFNDAIKWICWVMTAIGAVTLGVMMFYSVADICGRYFFQRPINGTMELVGLLVVVVGCLGLGYCQLLKGNINIDIVTSRFTPRGRAILNICSYLMSIAVCVIVAWQGFMRSNDYLHKTLGGETIILGLRLWPFMLFFSICFTWVTFIFILDLINAFREVFKHESD